jgi:hypothetical protein
MAGWTLAHCIGCGAHTRPHLTEAQWGSQLRRLARQTMGVAPRLPTTVHHSRPSSANQLIIPTYAHNKVPFAG